MSNMSALCQAGTLSQAACRRMLSLPLEPLFIADWERVLMIHYEVDPAALQSAVPFKLDLREGRAFVSLVAFSMRGMRPRLGGRLAAALLRPIATHDFLNVRTYVQHDGEQGIYFLAEWLSNRLSVALGPQLFGLPYRLGKIDYLRHHKRVMDCAGVGLLDCNAIPNGSMDPCRCEHGSLTEWLMERYTAFTHFKGNARFFRVWHQPWQQVSQKIEMIDQSLLEVNWPFFRDGKICGANFSRGLSDVWMGWPHRARESCGFPGEPSITAGLRETRSRFGRRPGNSRNQD